MGYPAAELGGETLGAEGSRVMKTHSPSPNRGMFPGIQASRTSLGLGEYFWKPPGLWHLPVALRVLWGHPNPAAAPGMDPWILAWQELHKNIQDVLRKAKSSPASSATTGLPRNPSGKELLPVPAVGGDGSHSWNSSSGSLGTLVGMGTLVGCGVTAAQPKSWNGLGWKRS